MTLQFVRPDIRQSCILLLAVSSHGQQYKRNREAGDCHAPVSALFGVGHRPKRPEMVDLKYPGAAARYYHFYYHFSTRK
jgi:hypothetical protein